MARQVLVWQSLLALLLSLPLCLVCGQNSSVNLIENGSFEDGVFASPEGDVIPNSKPGVSFPGWYATRGNISRVRGKQRSSDCSLTCVYLNDGHPATLVTSFHVAMPNYPHTLLFDTYAYPDPASPITGTFTVAVISAQNVTLNSSEINPVVGSVGWYTFGLTFMSPVTLQGNLSLSFSSNISGFYGAIIDNVRVFEGLHLSQAGQEANCRGAPLSPNPGKKPKIAWILASVIASVLVIILGIGVSIWRKRKQRNSRDAKATSSLKSKLRVFPYSVVKAATKNFHPDYKLGEGRFGAVYKGILEDGSEVAIKQLFLTTPQGQDEFLNEAMVISAVQHRNLVSLKGFCARGQERFLVCEYVENKSLYQVLWESKGDHVRLDWPKRFQIALGTARGLAYLHESSQPRIIHRDIKAGNILLDRKFEAKIADFGLAKWFPDGRTHVSTRIAGTWGYLAPEYAMRGQLSEKADVFSFGIVVLELVSGRKNLDYELPFENQYMLDWARTLWRQDKMKDLIDPEMSADIYMEEIHRVIRVGLWCTQEVAAMRPTMSEAISMLQGLSGQNEKDFTSSEEFNTLHIEASRLPLLLNDSASSFSMSNFSTESSSTTQGVQPHV